MKLAAALVASAVLVAGALGCSGDDDGSSDSDASTESTATPTTTAPSGAIEPGSTYVSLGSSIASGFGISVQSTDCGRSDRSYPNLVAAQLDLELTDVSCGAASIPHVVDTAQGANPPQLEALTADTALVTVSVGGNDIGYNATTLACSDPSSECIRSPDLDAQVAAVGPALLDMIVAIQAAAPEAVVVFVTYPREIPDTNCPELSMTDAEHAVVAEMGAELEQVFLDVAEQTDVVFVDPYPEPGDHTGCAPADDRWTAGAVADDGFAFHPTALGHEVMAEMILEALGADTR